MSELRKPTTDAVEILHRRFICGDKEKLASLAEERVKSELAMRIYDLRSVAGLTQKQLAERVGVKENVIANLEETDYEDDWLSTLSYIAFVLDKQVRIEFVPLSPSLKPRRAEQA